MTITVVIPLFNKKNTILRSLDSVLKQKVLPDEIIVVNDGSSDGSENEVENLNHPLITLVHQKNQGVSAARNKGIEIASSEWIAFLDADDEWKKNYLQKMKSLNKIYPFCDVLGSAYEIKNSKGLISSIILNKIPFEEDQGVLTNYFEVSSCSSPPIWTSAVVVRKTALIKVKGFPEGVTSGEDLLTWAKLSLKYKIAYSKKIDAIYNFDTTNEQFIFARKQDKVDVVGTTLAQMLSIYNKDKFLQKFIALWHRMRLKNYTKIGDKKNATIEFIKILNYSKTDYKSFILFFLVFIPKKIRIFLFHKKTRITK